eukprot:gene30042-35016_t
MTVIEQGFDLNRSLKTMDLCKGVRYFANGGSTNSIVMRNKSGTVRFIETYHRWEKPSMLDFLKGKAWDLVATATITGGTPPPSCYHHWGQWTARLSHNLCVTSPTHRQEVFVPVPVPVPSASLFMFACFAGLLSRGSKIPEEYSRPNLYGAANDKVDLKRLKRLIQEGSLVPCFPGAEEPTQLPEMKAQRALVLKILRVKKAEEPLGDGLEECPICFLHYPVLNTSRCCAKRICTECFLQVQTSVPADVSPTCPFCKVPDYTAKFIGAKSLVEREGERMEEQKLIESRIREREDEILRDQQRALERIEQQQAQTQQAQQQQQQPAELDEAPVEGVPVSTGSVVTGEVGPTRAATVDGTEAMAPAQGLQRTASGREVGEADVGCGRL